MPRMRQHGVDRRGVPDQNVGDALDVIEIDHWNARSRREEKCSRRSSNEGIAKFKAPGALRRAPSCQAAADTRG